MASRVRSKKAGHASSRVGGQPTSTPGTSSSRTAAAGPTSSASGNGISASVSRLVLSGTRADSTAANTNDSTPANRSESTPANRPRADPTPATRARSRVGVTQLHLTDEGFLMPPKAVSQACTKIFKKIQNSTGYTWTSTAPEKRNEYWEEFKKYFTWDPDLESVIQELWEDKAQCRYRDFVHRMKLKAEGAEDKIAAKPPYITSADWLGWLEYWEREDVKEKSTIAKRCRMSEPEGPGTGRVTHRGGSKSIVQFAYELAAKKGCTPQECLYDAYCMSHQKEDGTYTDAKSTRIGKKIQERVQELRSALSGTTEEREVNMNQAFLDVVSLDEKNRLFGTGELACLMTSEVPRGTSRYHTEAACGSRITEMELQLTEERSEREKLTTITHELKEVVERQQQQLQMLLSQSGASFPSPP